MRFEDFVRQNKPILQTHFQEFLKQKKAEKSNLPFYHDSLERLEKLGTAGKMWRGLFILLTYELITGTPSPKELLTAAVAMELAQTSLLIHDDIIDNDFTRRGQKTIFAQYIKDEDITYGKNLGICVGDIALHLSYELLAVCTTEARTLSKIIQLFAKELHLVIIGEMIDIDLAASKESVSLDSIFNMYRYKTARYSFSLPFLMGAILANADNTTCSALETFGENIGILFQIHDDTLGLTGDEKVTGKPVGADIKENKKTIHRTLLFEHATPEEVTLLEASFGTKELSEESRKHILSLLEKYQVQSLVETHANTYTKEALQALDNLSISSEPFRDILKKVTSRVH